METKTISNHLKFRPSDYIENKNDLLNVLKQIDNNNEYIQLRELIVNFLSIKCINENNNDNFHEIINCNE